MEKVTSYVCTLIIREPDGHVRTEHWGEAECLAEIVADIASLMKEHNYRVDLRTWEHGMLYYEDVTDKVHGELYEKFIQEFLDADGDENLPWYGTDEWLSDAHEALNERSAA